MPTDVLTRQAVSMLQIGRALDIAVAKTRANLPDMVRQPTTWSVAPDGDYTTWDEDFFAIGNWTNGFFAGMGVLAWERSGDDGFLKQLEALEPMFQAKLEGENAKNTMHDLGFLYSPYAVALFKKTGDPRWRELGLKAADILAGRFIENGGYFRAWGRMDEIGTDYDGLAIIDCLMNMPLLHWASEATGDSRYHQLAVRHTDTTLENFVRNDGSVYHAFRFDLETGNPSRPDNYCGYHPESHWARGTTWAMYGFALAYRHTGDRRFLHASQNVTRKFISCLDEEIIPVWDFRLSPDSEPLRDSSAAAVAACAIQELEDLEAADEEMTGVKHQLIDRMLTPEYFNASPGVRGFLKCGEIGDGADEARHFYRAKSAYTSWGDYYLMEALGRELGLTVNWW